jgi:hypothetical protein
MKGIDNTGAHLVHGPGWMDGWVDGSKSHFKDCLQQSTNCHYVGLELLLMYLLLPSGSKLTWSGPSLLELA